MGSPAWSWRDPLAYILSQRDEQYVRALAQRARDLDQYSRLEGLWPALP